MGWESNPFVKIRKIGELDRVISQNTAGAARAGAEELLPYVKAGAPHGRTLILVNTMRLQPGDSRPGHGEWEAVTDGFYWKFHEYGTSKMPAHPFVRPAIDHHSGDVARAAERHITQQTRRVTG